MGDGIFALSDAAAFSLFGVAGAVGGELISAVVRRGV
jgi:hypothetical protein